MAENCAYASVLESTGTTRDGVWLRKCRFPAGKIADDAGDNRAPEPDEGLSMLA
jgi:hypothetical protein